MKSAPFEEQYEPPTDYALGDLTIKLGAAQVLRGGHEIALPRLSFDLLLVLARAAPNLVTTEELMSRVWPGLVVSPETVSQRIKLLRGALDDDARSPKYIAGVRGRGYRIVAPVRTLINGVDGTSPAKVPLPAASERQRSPFLWPSAALAAVLIAAIAVWAVRFGEPRAPALPQRSVAVLPFRNLGNSPQDSALAFGVAETLLHRLASSKDLVVIARTSSFSFASADQDAREVGRKLHARYLVEGSLQSDASRLRITAQLIDAQDGSHVWSMQFDRKPEDIFTVQDEIANRVTQAMQLTMAGVRGSGGTRDFDAYLAYAQGRSRLASGKVADAQLAISDLERAIRTDPQYADAHVSLARALWVVAELDVTEERRANVEAATARGRKLLERALQIDPGNAEGHFERGLLLEDNAAAEAELRKGLELNPNSAIGYARLSDLLWWTDRRNESLAAIDRARQLDPLELDYDNIKARALLYGRSDVQQAEELSLKVLERDPSSFIALMRLGEVYWCCRGQFARGAKYLEQALRSEPGNEFARRMLMRAYLDMGDPQEAEAIGAAAPHPVAARNVAILLYRHQWRAAGEQAYDATRRYTGEAIDDHLRALAVRMHAATTGDLESARRFLEARAQVTWSADGTPKISAAFDEDFAVPLAGVLLRQGQSDRAKRLLQATLARFDYESHQLGRGEMWYLRSSALALALLRRDDGALRTLERVVEVGFDHDSWAFIEIEPEYERFRSLPRFRAIVAKARENSAKQRDELRQLRAAQLIPYRTGPKGR